MIFLDFEDTWSAWLNPYSELAYAIQRFAITKSDRESFESSKYLIDSYFKSRTSTINFNIDIEKTLRTLSVRAFLLLIDLSSNGSKVKKCEWNKFLFFYNQTLKRKKLFNKISTHINRQQ